MKDLKLFIHIPKNGGSSVKADPRTNSKVIYGLNTDSNVKIPIIITGLDGIIDGKIQIKI